MKYNNLEDLLKAMKNRVDRNVKYYKTDLNYDVEALKKAAVDPEACSSYLWINRESGTWLIKLEAYEGSKKASADFWEACKQNYSYMQLYKIDLKTMELKKITAAAADLLAA